jgi:drug/metabolite transporter (DMT)-like permease
MGEGVGVLMAIVSSAIGGTSAALIRFMIGSTDALTLSALRFGGGFIALIPVALLLGSPWPKGRDWIGVVGLGILFFGLCFFLFNWALSFTTAARGALAMSTLPLLTMLAGAVLGLERLTWRKSLGVLIAIGGTTAALITGLAAAPPEAWHGDLIMIAAALCYALYNVWSRPFIKRSAPLTYTTATMGAGAAFVAVAAWVCGDVTVLADYDAPHWLAILYLGTIGSALSTFLWISALERTTPTRVASTSTLNPVTTSALAAVLLGEPIGLNIVVGVAAVLGGIWIASTDGRRRPGAANVASVAYQADYWNGWRPGYRAGKDDVHRT